MDILLCDEKEVSVTSSAGLLFTTDSFYGQGILFQTHVSYIIERVLGLVLTAYALNSLSSTGNCTPWISLRAWKQALLVWFEVAKEAKGRVARQQGYKPCP